MKLRVWAMALGLTFAICGYPGPAWAAPSPCRTASVEGELHAGQLFRQPLGGGLAIFFQPIEAGWILRIVPASGPQGDHDYAELATPPYNSVSPLSLSTDFSFRAQDAVGWNPRRFHFAASRASFQRLRQTYLGLMAAGNSRPGSLESKLAGELAGTFGATLTIVDARLIPGTADQSGLAAGVASHFAQTPHTLAANSTKAATPLGRLLWLRFRLELDLPAGFAADGGVKVLPRNCGKPGPT